MLLSVLIKELQNIQELTEGNQRVFVRNQREFGTGELEKMRFCHIEVGSSLSVFNAGEKFDEIKDSDEIILIGG